MKCRKNAESKNSKNARTKNGKIMLLSKYAVCGSKKSKFMKDQEASVLLSRLGIKTQYYFIMLVFRFLIYWLILYNSCGYCTKF